MKVKPYLNELIVEYLKGTTLSEKKTYFSELLAEIKMLRPKSADEIFDLAENGSCTEEAAGRVLSVGEYSLSCVHLM